MIMFHSMITRLFICTGSMFATSVYLQFFTDLMLDDNFCLLFGIPCAVIAFIWFISVAHKEFVDEYNKTENLKMHVLDELGDIKGDRAKQARITLHDMDYSKGSVQCRTEIKTIAKIFNISLDNL